MLAHLCSASSGRPPILDSAQLLRSPQVAVEQGVHSAHAAADLRQHLGRDGGRVVHLAEGGAGCGAATIMHEELGHREHRAEAAGKQLGARHVWGVEGLMCC